ncbi:unnamed protein product [Musa textilis]
MSDPKDPAIMLFGTTIPVATTAADGEEAEVEEADAEPVVFTAEGQEDASEEVTTVEANGISAAAPDEENEGAPMSSSGLTSSNEEDGKTSIADEKKAVKNTVEDTKLRLIALDRKRSSRSRIKFYHVLAVIVWTPNSAIITTITLTSLDTSARIVRDIGLLEEP